MDIDLLVSSEGQLLSKKYAVDKSGGISKETYPHVRLFNSIRANIENIYGLHEIIEYHSSVGHCLLKGLLDRPLKNESRAKHTDPDAPTRWLVLDNDHVDDLKPESLLELMGINDVDYIVQYSASAGIIPDKNSYHVFLLLDRDYTPRELKCWIKHHNLFQKDIRQSLSLSRTNLSLRWPIDVSVNQNDKLIYIAPPICGPGIVDPLSNKRIQLIKGSHRVAALDLTSLNEQDIDSAEQEAIAKLRTIAGLPSKTVSVRKINSHDVISNPERSVVTGVKEGRDFVYLNLNGGDSWGYYHPKHNAEILFNFKGEPNYLIKELLPDYYRDAKTQAEQYKSEQRESDKKQAVENYLTGQTNYFDRCRTSSTRAYLAFRDRETDQYHIGYHDYASQQNHFRFTSSKDKIKDYLKQYNQPKPEIVETWTYAFRPDLEVIFDPQKRFINKFHPSKFILDAEYVKGSVIPTHINRLLGHVSGNDQEVMDHLVNWIATIFQRRIRTQSAWILHGTTGTGKGLLFSEIIRPLIGENYCRSMTLPNLEDPFNKFTAETIVLFVDEVDTGQIRQIDKLIAKLKNMITEPKLAVRAMRADLQEAPNYQNIIMASNQPNSMRIEKNDRRFNVAPRQEEKLFRKGDDADSFIKELRAELPAFADYLKSYPISEERARTCLENEAKQQMQVITQTALEEVTHEVREGNLEYFMAMAPGKSMSCYVPFDGRDINLASEYHRLLKDATRYSLHDKSHFLSHLDLFVLTEMLVGKMPNQKGRLASKLSHAGIVIGPKSDGQTSLGRGYITRWKSPRKDLEHWATCLNVEIPGDIHANAA